MKISSIKVPNTYVKHVLFIFLILIIFFIGLFVGKINFFYGEYRQDLQEIKKIELDNGKKVATKIIAVDSFNKGVSADLITELRRGSGLVLVNINNILADVNAQYSARVAAQVAKEHTSVSLGDVDIIFKIVTNASIVGGQSAGTAMTLSVLSLLLDKEINKSVAVTGSILENGTIGEAGSIYEKALAAKEEGIELFLVPDGSVKKVKNYKKIRRCGSFDGKELCETLFEEDIVGISEDLGIKILEAKDIEEASKYYFV